MLTIPEGSFFMGSCTSAAAGKPPLGSNCGALNDKVSVDETPQHKVVLKSFKMAKTEVTLGQFKAFIAGADRSDLVDDEFMKYNNRGDTAPVVRVNWHDAKAYIDWLNKHHGSNYRLPSEAEWEYACRAGEYHEYCGSDEVTAVSWFATGNGHLLQQLVAQKAPNAFGLYDMSGNVSEWTEDCWNKSYSGAPANGGAWIDGDCKHRVIRGGSWSSWPSGVRSAQRGYHMPSNRHHTTGFRVAQDI